MEPKVVQVSHVYHWGETHDLEYGTDKSKITISETEFKPMIIGFLHDKNIQLYTQNWGASDDWAMQTPFYEDTYTALIKHY